VRVCHIGHRVSGLWYPRYDLCLQLNTHAEPNRSTWEKANRREKHGGRERNPRDIPWLQSNLSDNAQHQTGYVRVHVHKPGVNLFHPRTRRQ